jgi:DNA-binding MarR family transcriptional regulator
MSSVADARRLQTAFIGIVRALGLLRPNTTPCGQPMSISEAHALGELHRGGPVSQQALADALRLQKSTVSRLVDQLERQGLVTRSTNPADRRSVLLELTPTGTAGAGQLEAARRDLFQRLLAGLTPDERRTVIDGLTTLEEAAHALR